MVKRLACAALALSGCSLLDWGGLEKDREAAADAAGGTADAAPKDASSDAFADAPAGPRCDLSKKFSQPTAVLGAPATGNNNVSSGFLTPDLLTLVFARDADGSGNNFDLFAAQRNEPSGTFGDAVPLSGVNSAQDEQDPFLADDGLTLYFSTAPANGKDVLMTARRTSTSSWTFSGPAVAPLNGLLVGTKSIGAFQFLDDARTIYFTDYYNSTIYRTTVSTNGFTPPTQVDGLGQAASLLPNAVRGHVTDDERTIVFGVHDNRSMLDQIYVAKRSGPGVPFETPNPVDELNMPSNDYPTWMSGDGCRVLVVSTASGREQLYYAERSP